LFAADHQDKRLLLALQRLQDNNCDVKDRDMIIGVIVARGRSTLVGQPISERYASKLRSHYGISDDHFAMLLIGKDGAEKFRSEEVASLQQIFALIDGMPMRQNEMQENPVDCNRRSNQ